MALWTTDGILTLFCLHAFQGPMSCSLKTKTVRTMTTAAVSPASTRKGGGQGKVPRHAQQNSTMSEAVAAAWIRGIGPNNSRLFLLVLWLLVSYCYYYWYNILCVTYFNNMKTSEVSGIFRYRMWYWIIHTKLKDIYKWQMGEQCAAWIFLPFDPC